MFMSENDSIFTKIIRGEIPAHKIYEDDKVFAMLDIHPVHPGHTLVITKQQVDDIFDLDEELYSHLMRVSHMLGNRIRERLQPKRVGIIVEGFMVPHVHVHLVPIENGDDISTSRSKEDMLSEPDHEHLAEVAEKLTSATD